ncbi:MAG: DoxX family membrane protein [Acidobacteriaceae bacterium]
MMTSPVLWMSVAGLFILIIGTITVRGELAEASNLDKLIVLGPTLEGASLAAFGAEHLTTSRALMQLVPVWMPASLFWVYFVGFGLLAAGLSFALKKHVRLSAPLLAAMFLIFVLTMDGPGVVAAPHNRETWTLMFREAAFGAGGLAFFTCSSRQSSITQSRAALSNIFLLVSRLIIGAAITIFGVNHFMHPNFAPGFSPSKMTPVWVPFPQFWVYLVGTILLIAGLAMLFNLASRMAATCVGLTMTALTLFLYLPIFLIAKGPAQGLVGANYLWDTLLVAGTALLLADALPKKSRARALAPAVEATM